MRVRPDIDALTGQHLGRARLVEEDEGPDHLPLRRRQRTANLEAAEVAGPRDDEGLDRVERRPRRDIPVRLLGSSSCASSSRVSQRATLRDPHAENLACRLVSILEFRLDRSRMARPSGGLIAPLAPDCGKLCRRKRNAGSCGVLSRRRRASYRGKARILRKQFYQQFGENPHLARRMLPGWPNDIGAC